MTRLLDIIIPTFNNPQYLDPCVFSILRTGILNEGARVLIVNNGAQPIKEKWGGIRGVEILEPGKNLGWEGGLEHALRSSDARFVCFQNDDTFIPVNSSAIYRRLLTDFLDPDVAAVGPCTTTASGLQSVFNYQTPLVPTEVNWLIFFMVLLRRSDVDKAGGIDTTLPGGDDFDLSIRLRKLGKKVLINPAAFLIHHGFKTGTRVHGDGFAGVKDGWNSPEMIERTQHGLIKKHGFKTFVDHYYHQLATPTPSKVPQDIEGNIVRDMVRGESVLELGCGGTKTVSHAVGVDRVPRGEFIPGLDGVKSVADIVADAGQLPVPPESQDTVIARHILEHCVDGVATLNEWRRVLKPGGRLIIAVPDEAVTRGIPMNVEHCHAFTIDSLNSLASACGFQCVDARQTGNGVSFVSCFQPMPVPMGVFAHA